MFQKTRLKRRLSLSLLSAGLACVLLAGCGGGTGTSSGAPSNKLTEAEEKKDGEKVIEIWHCQTTDPMPTIIQEGVDRFVADHPNTKVNVTVMANDAYKQKISVAMGSGQAPDIFFSWGGGPMNEYINSGSIIEITSYMEKDNYKDRFLDAAVSQSTYEGKIYGFPVENVATANIFYNTELFEQYDLQEPKTLAELEAICDKLLENGITPFSLANKTQWPGSMLYINFATRKGGTQPFAEALAGTGSFENETFEFAGKKIQEWVNKGYFNDGFNGADEDSGQSRQLMYTGDAAMTMMGSWFLSTVKGENPEFYEKVGSFTFPAIEGAAGNPDTVVGTIGDNLYHISSTCQNPDDAFTLLTYLLDNQSVEARINAGRIPPLKDMVLADPMLQRVFDDVQKAPDMQLWYDQSLPPSVAEVHKVTSQEIFGNTMTPAAADTVLQQAMQEYLDKKSTA